MESCSFAKLQKATVWEHRLTQLRCWLRDTRANTDSSCSESFMCRVLWRVPWVCKRAHVQASVSSGCPVSPHDAAVAATQVSCPKGLCACLYPSCILGAGIRTLMCRAFWPASCLADSGSWLLEAASGLLTDWLQGLYAGKCEPVELQHWCTNLLHDFLELEGHELHCVRSLQQHVCSNFWRRQLAYPAPPFL